MKKTGMIFTLFTALSILSGCGSKIDKIDIYYKHQSLTTYITLDDEKLLEEKIEAKENFILVSFADESCACWGMFENSVLIPFVNDTKIPVYVIRTELLTMSYHGLSINSGRTNTPVIGIYKDGVYKVGTSYFGIASIFKKRNEFENYLDRHINRPLMTYVNLEQVNTLLSGNTPFILNWGLALCPDCKILDNIFTPKYLSNNKKNPKRPYYIIETLSKGLRLDDAGKIDAAQWQFKKDLYGLSDLKNNIYGYGTGYVPMVQIIDPDGTDYVSRGDISPIISDALVFQNETISYVNNKYVITQSYFNGTRATKYLGAYESELGTVIPNEAVYDKQNLRFDTEVRYDVQAAYAAKFYNHYWL